MMEQHVLLVLVELNRIDDENDPSNERFDEATFSRPFLIPFESIQRLLFCCASTLCCSIIKTRLIHHRNKKSQQQQ